MGEGFANLAVIAGYPPTWPTTYLYRSFYYGRLRLVPHD